MSESEQPVDKKTAETARAVQNANDSDHLSLGRRINHVLVDSKSNDVIAVTVIRKASSRDQTALPKKKQHGHDQKTNCSQRKSAERDSERSVGSTTADNISKTKGANLKSSSTGNTDKEVVQIGQEACAEEGSRLITRDNKDSDNLLNEGSNNSYLPLVVQAALQELESDEDKGNNNAKEFHKASDGQRSLVSKALLQTTDFKKRNDAMRKRSGKKIPQMTSRMELMILMNLRYSKHCETIVQVRNFVNKILPVVDLHDSA